MATYSLRRFANVATIKSIAPVFLQQLLVQHSAYFDARGLNVNEIEPESFNYNQLVQILMSPTHETPVSLLDTLYYIDEMATPEAMELLLQESEANHIQFDCIQESTPADIAVQTFMQNREFLERKHAEQQIKRPRAFESFLVTNGLPREFILPDEDTVNALQNDLDKWYEKKKRGRGSHVFIFPKHDTVWLLIRHGDTWRREGSLQHGESTSIFYRPEKYDILVYNSMTGELKMNACGKSEKQLLKRR